MTVSLKQLLSEIQDQYIKQFFQWIKDFLNEQDLLLSNFKFFSLNFGTAVTKRKIPHGLKFKPQDVILTSKIGAGAVTFVYDEFTGTDLVITTTGACDIRFFAGLYVREGAIQ